MPYAFASILPMNFKLTSSFPKMIARPFLFRKSSKFLRLTSPSISKVDSVLSISSLGLSSSIETILSSLGCNYDKKSRKARNPSYRFDLEIHSDYQISIGQSVVSGGEVPVMYL